MQLVDDSLVFSPSDLHHFLECRHLAAQLVAVAHGTIERPEMDDDATALLRARGLEHEKNWLAQWQREGKRIVQIEKGSGQEGWQRAAAQTIEAMRAGADVIYQAVLMNGSWRGVADFLVRVDRKSELGDWGYEAWDTKLAQHSKPYYLMQLAFYSGELTRIQGVKPGQMHVVLGTGDIGSFPTTAADAYTRALQARLEIFGAAPPATAPYPIAHCAFCAFKTACDETWRRGDHLSLVAHMRREQAARLAQAGISTVSDLAAVDGPIDVRIGATALQSLTAQARLQDEARRTGIHRYELLPPAAERGFRLLPPSSAGDLFFDMEGFPFFEPAGGLEYLFGVMWIENGQPHFKAFWARDRAEEKRAFEDFIDFVWARVKADPALHIYHYASYEDTAIKALTQLHGTRVEEVDELLRREKLVDLYRIVRQTMRISHDSYGLKKVRMFFMPDAGQGPVADAAGSIVEFDRWMQTGDDAILENIERYNEEDCLSTMRLRDWLVERRDEAQVTFGVELPWREAPAAAKKEVETEPDEHAELREALVAGGGPEERATRELLGHLLYFHRREQRPEFWAYYERQKKTLADLLDDPEAISGLRLTDAEPPTGRKRSRVYTFEYPEQEFKLDAGDNVEDQAGGLKTTLLSLDTEARTLQVATTTRFHASTAPGALVAGAPILTLDQRKAVRRCGDYVDVHGLTGPGPYRAGRDLLSRAWPRVAGIPEGGRLQATDLEVLRARVGALDDSYLFFQGPPGSGKTWTGARLITHLLRQRKRVGVTALSHRAIHNLLEEIEAAAIDEKLRFRGLKKGSTGRADSRFESAHIECETDAKTFVASDAALLAGTSFQFAREDMEDRFDYLFLDEAGQISLGDAIAMSGATRNLVLLGDPQQLPNVSKGRHAEGVGVSVLQHLLGDAATVAENRGIFLERTRRLHPDVCDFVSALAYEERLKSHESCARQGLVSAGISGTGLHYIPVDHDDNTQMSEEEVEAVAREVATLLATGIVTAADGESRPCRPEDILVVAPYNMQVRELRRRMPAGVECGTVDKFQGREAAVVFFSMATSSGDDIPRNVDFLFSRNRLNVAVSRARCAAVVIASPRLLEVRCRTTDQLQLVNAFCRLVETARSRQEGHSSAFRL